MHWQPTASIETLRQRAALIQNIRHFFNARAYLEVETPIMAQFGVTDVYLSNIKARFRNQDYCLQTSPEYHMKRLLAAGSGPIFQLIKAFRDDELGRWHNPEFTMLEWYKLAANHHQLMEEMDALLQLILQCPPLIKKTYQQVFTEICAVNPFSASIDELQTLLESHQLHQVLAKDESDRDQYLFLLMSHIIEPALQTEKAPIAIYDFPPSQASLAKINDNVAERFEIFYQGVELANGFHELSDATMQRARFEHDIAQRAQKKLEKPVPDAYFLASLQAGLPACSGVALGVDRLLALALGKKNIAEVLSFTIHNA